MTIKKNKYIWNNFREGLSDDKYVAKPSTFQVSSNVDIRTNPIGVQLSPKLIGQYSYSSPVVGIFDMSTIGLSGIMTYHANGQVFVEGVLKLDIGTNSADTNKTIFNVFFRHGPLTGDKLFFVGSQHISCSNTDFSTPEYDKYDMGTNTDTISRPLLVQGDTARICVANNIYKLTPNNLSADVFSSEAVFDPNLKINDITYSGQYYNIFLSEGNGNQGNGLIYKMDFKMPKPNYIIYMPQNPIRKAINDGIQDYVITGYSEDYSDLWLVNGFQTQLIKRGVEKTEVSRFKFNTGYQKSQNRKGIMYISGKHDGDEGIFSYGSYFPTISQIFVPSFAFDTVVIPNGHSGAINAIHATSNMLYVAYTLDGTFLLGRTELQYSPTQGYKQSGHIRSNRFNAGAMFPRKSIEEINVMYDMSTLNGHSGSIEPKYSIDGGAFISLGVISTGDSKSINDRFMRIYANSLSKTFFNEIEFDVVINSGNTGMDTPVFHGIEMIYGFEQFD